MTGNNRTKNNGFTLIELMIVVAVIGILAGIAYPTYIEQVKRSNRTEAKNALLDAAARQERHYSDINSYGSLAIAGIGTSSETGLYTISIAPSAGGTQAFTLTATSVRSDGTCTTLTLTQTGIKGNSGSGSAAECWNR